MTSCGQSACRLRKKHARPKTEAPAFELWRAFRFVFHCILASSPWAEDDKQQCGKTPPGMDRRDRRAYAHFAARGRGLFFTIHRTCLRLDQLADMLLLLELRPFPAGRRALWSWSSWFFVIVIHTACVEERGTPAPDALLLPALVRSCIVRRVPILLAGPAHLMGQPQRKQAFVLFTCCSDVHESKTLLA